MGSAAFPLAAIGALAFIVYRWAGDELERDRKLSFGAASAVVALALFHAIAVLLSAYGGIGAIDVPLVAALLVGVPVALSGGALAFASARAIDSRERMIGIQIDTVVERGPYARMRHPFYVGWTLALLGVALAGRSILALILVVVLAAVLFVLARTEERLLVDAGYEQYRERTRALPLARL